MGRGTFFTYSFVLAVKCSALLFTLLSDSILGQDIGICIVCYGLLVVFVFCYFDIVPTHTKNYAKAYIKKVFRLQNYSSGQNKVPITYRLVND